MNLSDLKRKLAIQLHGREPDGKTCIECNQPPIVGKNIYSEAGAKEFHISGYCESCFDKLFE